MEPSVYYILWHNSKSLPWQEYHHNYKTQGKAKAVASKFLADHYIPEVAIATKAPAGNWIILLRKHKIFKNSKGYVGKWEEERD